MDLKRKKGPREREVRAIRTALKTWLGPQLSTINEQLTKVEARLDAIDRSLDRIDKRSEPVSNPFEQGDKRSNGLEKRLDESINSLRTEMRAEFSAVHSEIRRLDNIADLRERMASIEAKLGAQQG
jgi:chromosome segregation ATPase